jgi:site-specific DNA-cytosine methylase
MRIRYLSLCSGIEAASVAWEPLGFECVGVAEIDPFACALLKHRYPDVPNLGNILEIDGREWRGKVDVLIGGTPCQSFSVAGLRRSLQDTRGNLTLKFVELYHAIRPRYAVWENVAPVIARYPRQSNPEVRGALPCNPTKVRCLGKRPGSSLDARQRFRLPHGRTYRR